MKLYATVTSERASKGQGGNKQVDIELMVGDAKNPKQIARLVLKNNDTEFLLFADILNNPNRMTLYRETKGNKQKGENIERYAGTTRMGDLDIE